jgi:hypothetical protein
MEPTNPSDRQKSIEELLHQNHTDLMNLLDRTVVSKKTIKDIKHDIIYIEYRKNCKQLADLRVEMVMEDFQNTIKQIRNKT